MSDKVISVIIPVFNAEQFISETIKSVLSQTYEHIELILINDGSTDGSEAIIEEWLSEDERVVCVNQQNQGPSASRNNGLSRSMGDYILFVDADDELKPDSLEKMIKSISESDILIYGYENLFDKDAKNSTLVFPQKNGHYSLNSVIPSFGTLFSDNLIHYVWNKLYKKECLQEVRFNESIKVGEDLLFNLEVLSNTQTISMSKDILYTHNWFNNDSITEKFHRNLFEYRKIQFEKTRNFLNSHLAYSEENRQEVEEQFFHKYLACLLSLESKESQLTYQEKKKLIKSIAEDAKTHHLLTYSGRTYWEKLVIFLMKHQLISALYVTNKGLKVMQEKRRHH